MTTDPFRLSRRALIASTGAGALAAALPARAQADKQFVVATNLQPDVLDPSLSRNAPVVRPTLNNVVEPVVGTAHDGSVTPLLANWTILDGGKTIEFKVRPNVRFHSGDPLTAADIVWSHERAGARNASYGRYMRLYTGAEVVDDLTARFHFKNYDAGFIPGRGLLALSKAYHDRVGEDQFVASPVGTGPYKFVGYRAGEYLDVAANDGYWGGAPQVRNVRFVFIREDATRVAKLKAGEADIVMNVPWGEVAGLKTAGFTIVGAEVTPSTSVYFDILNPKTPWADRRVRMAIANAIDADAIINGLFQGIPKHYPCLAPGQIGYDPSLKNYPFDVAAARKLLAEAGYAGGFKMPLYYLANNYFGVKESTEAVSLYLKQVGIDCNVQGLDGPQFEDLAEKMHKDPTGEFVCVWPLVVANFNDPQIGMNLHFYSQGYNALYKNPDFDKLYDAALSEPDEEKRADDIRAAYKVVWDDVGRVPLWNNVAEYAMRKGVSFVPTSRTFVLMQLQDIRLG